jgi:uncharacterized UBP type Zn finger protein
MIVYIQKKINNRWHTILTISSTIAQQTLNHLRKHGYQYKFRFMDEAGFIQQEIWDEL